MKTRNTFIIASLTLLVMGTLCAVLLKAGIPCDFNAFDV
jgi:hypothetical protein